MDKLFLIRGFDLYFHNVTQPNLEQISQNLGGNSSFNLLTGVATYFFENQYYIDKLTVKKVHDWLSSLGHSYSEQYECEYLYSELYLRVNQQTYEDTKINSNEFHIFLE